MTYSEFCEERPGEEAGEEGTQGHPWLRRNKWYEHTRHGRHWRQTQARHGPACKALLSGVCKVRGQSHLERSSALSPHNQSSGLYVRSSAQEYP